jgi:hypothetical protein
MKEDTILLLAGVCVGGYFLIQYLLNNPVVKGVTETVGTVNKAADTIGLTTTDKIASFISPPLAVTNVMTKLGEKAGYTPSDIMASAIFPPMALANMITKTFFR